MVLIQKCLISQGRIKFPIKRKTKFILMNHLSHQLIINQMLLDPLRRQFIFFDRKVDTFFIINSLLD